MSSLLNVMLSEDVDRLLKHELLDDLPDAERAFSREKTAAIIHAALWAHSARSGSTASAYALNSLFNAIGLETWTFKKRSSQETPAAPPCPDCGSTDPGHATPCSRGPGRRDSTANRGV